MFPFLAKRWNELAPPELATLVQRDVIEQYIQDEGIIIDDYNLKPHTVKFTTHWQQGFIGTCKYLLRGPDDPTTEEAPLTVRQQVLLLGQLAFYSGVGYKTPMGMGRTRMVQGREQTKYFRLISVFYELVFFFGLFFTIGQINHKKLEVQQLVGAVTLSSRWTPITFTATYTKPTDCRKFAVASAIIDRLNRRLMENIAEKEYGGEQVFANGAHGGLFLIPGDTTRAEAYGQHIQRAYREQISWRCIWHLCCASASRWERCLER